MNADDIATAAAPIVILGIGCTLFADQGFGIRVIEELQRRFDFPGQVQVVDGGLAGVALTGILAGCRHVVAVDILTNGGSPGYIYRLEGHAVLSLLQRRGGHIQQVEFLEALAHCQAFDQPPGAVLIGVEPSDARSVGCELSPLLQGRIEPVIAAVCRELDRLGAPCRPAARL